MRRKKSYSKVQHAFPERGWRRKTGPRGRSKKRREDKESGRKGRTFLRRRGGREAFAFSPHQRRTSWLRNGS